MISPLKWARMRWIAAMTGKDFREQARARYEYLLAVRRAEKDLAIRLKRRLENG
jgi:hypothetical protein